MEELLRTLKRNNIAVSLDKSDLKVKFNGTALPADLVRQLKDNKASLIKYLSGLNKEAATGHIGKAATADHYPLSSSQRRVWMVSQLEDGNRAYNMPGVFLFEGNFDLSAFSRALDALIARHESLRTVFREVEDEARQFILLPHEAGFRVDYRDLREEGDRDSKAKELIQAALVAPFNLSTGPLLRVGLYRIADDRHVFVYVMHHIISDGWSLNIMIRELFSLYNAYTGNAGEELLPLRIQYKDYAVWQQEQLSDEKLSAHQSYWLKQFEGTLPVIDFPTDYERPAMKTYNGRLQSWYIAPALSKGIKALSQEQGGTLFMGLLAAINVLMYRYTGQEDQIIGTPVAGREHADLEDQIGFYLNTLALRAKFSGSHTFRELLENVRQVTLAAYEHQVYPFDKLVDELHLKRDLSRGVLFDVMILLQNTQQAEAIGREAEQTLGDIRIKGYGGGESVVSKYDLTFYFTEVQDTIRLDIEYNNDLFNAATIERLEAYFEQLLAAATAAPERTIDELVFMNTGSQLIEGGHDTITEFACTHHQERLWFIDQFEKNYLYQGSPVYHNLPLIVRFNEKPDIGLLNDSIRKCIDRYAILRTTVVNRNSVPFQVTGPGTFDGLKVQHVAGSARDRACVIRHCLTAIEQPMEIDSESLVRFNLLEFEDGGWVFVITAHHLIADRQSLRLLFNEITAHYCGTPVTNEGQLQYADLAVWQKGLPADALAPLSVYWKKKLKDAPVLYLDTDNEREHIHIYSAAEQQKILTPELSARVHAFCNDRNITPFTFLLTAFNTLLYRYTGSDEIVIGTLYPNRDNEAVKAVIGPVANLLTLKSEVKPGVSFRELLQQVASDYQRAVECAAVPFEKVVLDVNPGKDMSRTALFDIMIHYEKEEHAFDIVELNYGLGKYDFNLLIKDGSHLEFFLTYNERYFGSARIERLLEHYTGIIEAALNGYESAVSGFPYLAPAETAQLLHGFNETGTAYPREKTIVHLFEEQVALTPDNIAVVFEDTTLTYRELNEQANRLGKYLRTVYGIRPDDLVGIKLDRSEKMIIAILGILKSGGAYVPVEPDYPQDRIDFMLSDSGCRVLIDPVEWAKFEAQADKYAAVNPPVVNLPGDLAYVIYTSGTTGKPKGTLIEHNNVVRLFKTEKQLYDFKPTDVWTVFHSYCFDFSVWEMYGALLYGGKVVVVPAITAKDPDAFIDLLCREGVTVLNQTPSAFDNLVRHELARPSAALKLRYVIFGGEALNPGNLKEWRKRYPGTCLVNMYGITETTVHVTFKEITEKEIERGSSNIGMPIPTLRCYVLDQHQQLLPVGTSGELYVGGEGVSRGYLNREELTARRFIESPFNRGERLYRSGDKVKLLENGEMEYIGRIDNQVKIRGYRIELGEVENVLRRYEKIDDVVVLARKDDRGETSLVAYVVSREQLNVTALRLALAQYLPAYMLPGYFVQLERLPLTSNGKIDKKNLPDPAGMDLSAGTTYVAPRNATEAKLAAIWQEVLDRESVSITDNFFELGGHSLKATRLTNLIHKEFDIRIALRDIFTKPVLEEQALLVANAGKSAFTAISPAPVQPHYPLSSSQRRIWMLCQLEGSSTAYNMPGAFVFEGALDRTALSYALSTLVARHESLRTVFRETEAGEIRQFILQPEMAGISLAYNDLRDAADTERQAERQVQKMLAAPFDLAQGPLLRAGLYRVAGNKWFFGYVMHHIISDGWSMNILMNELLQCYNAACKEQEAALPHLNIQYKDYAVWQQEQLAGDILNGHRAWWLEQFKGELPVLELPADRPRPVIKTYHGGTVHKEIGKEPTRQLRRIVQEESSTLFMGILAAVNVLLHRYSGQDDIIIGSPIAGRTHDDLKDQIGFYVNTLALRTRFSKEDSYLGLLSAVKQATLGAYEHQVYPFDELVDELRLQRDTSRSPLFDVMVMLQNNEAGNSGAEQGMEHVIVRQYGNTEEIVSKFDLTFNFVEAGDTLQIDIEYNRDIYEADTVARMANHLEQLFTAVTANPHQPVSQLNYLDHAEQEQLLITFNQAASVYPADKTVIDLFEEQVYKTPDDTAVIFGETSLSYRKLNEQANRLASYLRSVYRLEPNDLVAIKQDRSEWMIISILGVLKSGAAYVPVDPAYPADRIEYLLSDSGCKVLIDEAELNRFRAEADGYSPRDMKMIQHADHLAYVIYTSGSTGLPKGCTVTCSNLSGYIQWANSYYFNETGPASFGLYTSLSFDLTVTSIFCPLTQGGRLFVYRQDEELPSILEHSFSPESGINCIKLTPSHIHILKQLDIHATSVQCAIVGGEDVTPEQVNILKSISQGIRIYNEYGPTEATVGCIVKELEPDTRILIGKPISGTGIYILDDELALCPVGIPGEIFIRGTGVAKGYLNKPELTRQKFLPDPFAGKSAMYRTGDLARWLPDGDIEFFGRKDDQVKIRGHRIELGEIESALQDYPGINAAAVIARAGKDGQKELVAYITGVHTLSTSEIRAFLVRSLPVYMLPDHYVQLETLPLTQNGKVDRKRLPDPGDARLTTGQAYEAPRNEKEACLVAVWQEVLGDMPIGINDNFFDLGGNSMKLMKMVGLLNKTLGCRISVVSAFRFPSIAALAAYLGAAEQQDMQAGAEEDQRSVDIMEETFSLLNE
ncbi:non-ribosomal peptide synthetase [Chitinophaga tropicalis]|uniref:Amino acid adenylation domain-containing protein n=1 Tax=Chitinophaga tropicalis TaxID=2683588 RepID=A0A7K1UAL4_9BACT|nr:non-ribosomal peptide synthetase [Chitinophaga tropicalis]MVT11422.1 amino acid adenylation domain-containing protein [Chitinophaga tropicalis]